MRNPRLWLPGLVLVLLAGQAVCIGQAPAAELIATIETSEDLAVLAAWSPDGQRLAYATEKQVRKRRAPSLDDREFYTYPGEVWVTDLAAKPRRVFKHERFRDYTGNVPSFYVTQVAWSPNGLKLAVEVTDEGGESLTFLITPEGKAVKIESSRGNFLFGYNAGWLSDNASLGLLEEALNPRLLHRVRLVRISGGRELGLFRDDTFAAVAWLPLAHKAVLVQRDRDFMNASRLLLGDLETGAVETLDDLGDSYLGGLQVAPEETKVSYFAGQQKLAVRALARASSIEYWPIPLGRYQWAGSSDAVYFLQPRDRGRRTGWLTRYERAGDRMVSVLPDVLIQDFWVGPDGQRVAVLTSGLEPQLRIYQLAPAAATP